MRTQNWKQKVNAMSFARIVGGFLLLSVAATAQQYVISTYAGGAPPAIPSPAVAGSIGAPISVTADTRGNVYFASPDLNVVFKLDPSGVLTRVAGNGRAGYSGDGGPATSAQLRLLFANASSVSAGLAVDSAGNLFLADTSNHCIRRVSPDGIITTVAGNGTRGFSGDGGPATIAQLNYPWGVAVDDVGNLFIVDARNNRIRKVSASGIITTVAGGGTLLGAPADGGPATSALLTAWAAAVDTAGNLFIADNGSVTTSPRGPGSNRIRKVSPGGMITTVAENLFAWSLAVDGAGALFIADSAGLIRRISPNGSMTTVVGGGAGLGDGGPATSAKLANPAGVAVDAEGNLFIADRFNYRLRKVSPSGIITTAAGDGTGRFYSSAYVDPATDDRPATGARLSYPRGVAVDGAGNLFIADTNNNRVRKVSTDGTITTVVGNGTAGFSGDGGLATSAQLNSPIAVTVDEDGNLFILDIANGRVRKVSPNGMISTVAGNGTAGFSGDGGLATSAALGAFVCNSVCGGLTVDGAGNLFIADPGNGRVRKVSPSGIITTVAGGDGFFGDGPAGVAVDAAGNLFMVGDVGIRKVTPSGIVSTVAQLFSALAVAVDGAGNLFVATSNYEGFFNDERILSVSPSGMITTIAGTGQGSFSGDGGPASTATLNGPSGLALDSAGNLYVADSGNNVVRILQPANQSVLVGAVVDAASQRDDPVSPGKIVVIYGAGLGPLELVENQPSNGHFGTQLAGTTVSFKGIPAPILYTSATQVAAIVPYAVTGAKAEVTVTYQGSASAAFTVPMAASAPNLFTLNLTGAGQAAAINAIDGTVNTAANPVKIGGFISLYATGEGQTMPAGQDGRITGSALSGPILPLKATVGGIPATIQYAGSAPEQVAGLMQVNVQIPSGVQPGGYVPVVLQVGDRTSSPAVWIAVH
jgi:uncharacterized protein (TIGR03437 family)